VGPGGAHYDVGDAPGQAALQAPALVEVGHAQGFAGGEVDQIAPFEMWCGQDA